jgi:subtilase family serine protease
MSAASGAAPSAARVTLSAALPTLQTGAIVQGPLASTQHLSADVVLSLRDQSVLSTLIQDVSTPDTPDYRHYLAPGQFAAQFAPTAATVASVRAWLSHEGLSVGTTDSDGFVIPVSGSAGDLSSAFDTTLSQVALPSGAESFLNTTALSVPAALAGTITNVTGLNGSALWHDDLLVKATKGVAASGTDASHAVFAPHDAGPQACGQAQDDANEYGIYTQSHIAQVYGLSSLFNDGRSGAGQAIGVFELESFSVNDVDAFASCYGITPDVAEVSVDGGGCSSTPGSCGAGSGEAALDIENAMAFAPGAEIVVYEAPDSVQGPLDLFRTIADQDVAKVVTTSWGVCEPDDSSISAENEVFEQMAAQGQTLVAASGDDGSEDCYGEGGTGLAVDDPGSNPLVTSAGGTTLYGNDAETVWNTHNCLIVIGCMTGSGGGGLSSVWAMPGYQRDAGDGTINGYSTSGDCDISILQASLCREVPDVSGDADPNSGYTFFWNGQWGVVGGTSAVAPLWGAIFTLINQGCASPLGYVNPALYGLGGRSGDFNDVLQGNNDFLGLHGGDYPATPGFDLASGWGTPNAVALLNSLDSSGCAALSASSGYTMAAADGGVFNYGGADFYGSMGGQPLVAPVVGMAETPDGGGYWEVASDGGIFSFGNANFYGSMGGQPLVAPIVAMVATPDGGGYWEVASDGGIFSFGDANFFGSMGGRALVAPVVGMAATPDGGGYWEVARDGGIFAFGDANFYGSMGGLPLNRPIVGIAPNPEGGGYWMVASDGGIFSFGDADFMGSTGDLPLVAPVVGMAPVDEGSGYYLVAADGGIFAFGSATFDGSAGGLPLVAPIVAMAVQ